MNAAKSAFINNFTAITKFVTDKEFEKDASNYIHCTPIPKEEP